MNVLLVLALLSALFTVVVMVVGITGMVRQNDFNKKYGNKLMQMRVLGQGLTILFIVLAYANS